MIQMKWYNSIQFKLQFFICLVFILSVGAILVNNYINDKNNLGHSLKTSANDLSRISDQMNKDATELSAGTDQL
jgi:hypothetical protein